jgi:pimeloyl-ACP methyl ester carboxylesterase
MRRTRHALSWFFLCALATSCPLLASACGSWLPAPDPMLTIDAEQPGPRAACLMVFLPGGGDSAESFARQGFVDAVLATRYSIDMVAADATMGYYTRGVFTERLWRDVVRRRALRGYREVWLVGPSLGGFGSLLYARQRPAGEVSGVLALAPYLGNDSDLFHNIEAAGGLATWQAPARAEPREQNYVPELWRWLQALTSKREQGPELYLGCGRQDRLAKSGSLLAAALPPDHVYTREGGHKWATWRQLFDDFLQRGPLKDRCPATSQSH